jgi:fatty acid desaturase
LERYGMWFISYIHFHFSLFFIFFFVLRVLLNLTKVMKQERQKYHLWCFFFKKTNNSSFDGNPSHVMVEINDLYNVVCFVCWLFVIRSIILVLSVCVCMYTLAICMHTWYLYYYRQSHAPQF